MYIQLHWHRLVTGFSSRERHLRDVARDVARDFELYIVNPPRVITTLEQLLRLQRRAVRVRIINTRRRGEDRRRRI